MPIVFRYCNASVQKLLVGNKNDLPKAVPTVRIINFSSKILTWVSPSSAKRQSNSPTNADVMFMETSAKNNTNVDETFHEAGQPDKGKITAPTTKNPTNKEEKFDPVSFLPVTCAFSNATCLTTVWLNRCSKTTKIQLRMCSKCVKST